MQKDSRFNNVDELTKRELLVNCWTYTHGFANLVYIGDYLDPSDDFIKKKLLVGGEALLSIFL